MREFRIILVVIHTYVFRIGLFVINYSYVQILDTFNYSVLAIPSWIT
jgi:hypothetical protein